MGIPLRHKPNTNTEAVITIAAVSGTRHEIEHISWSYDSGGTLSGGLLTVESPSGTRLAEYAPTVNGPGFIPFSGSCIRGAVGEALIVRLAAGGSGVQGVVNCIQRG